MSFRRGMVVTALVCRRLTLAAAGATVSGDGNLLDLWLDRVGFG